MSYPINEWDNTITVRLVAVCLVYLNFVILFATPNFDHFCPKLISINYTKISVSNLGIYFANLYFIYIGLSVKH